MSAYNFEEDILFLKYMEEGIIYSTIETGYNYRLSQRVRDEFVVYQLALPIKF
jgi:hypothetical protein